VSSGDELMPTIADFDVPASRSGRKIQRPKPLVYQDEQASTQTMSYRLTTCTNLTRYSHNALLAPEMNKTVLRTHNQEIQYAIENEFFFLQVKKKTKTKKKSKPKKS
jgi:protein-arginine kinase